MSGSVSSGGTVALVELRAVVRLIVLDRVVHAMREAGCARLTVQHVHSIGAGVDPAAAKASLLEGTIVSDVALVQLVCGAERAAALTRALVEAARTGHQGDGIVTAHPVLDVTKIRTGESGEDALR